MKQGSGGLGASVIACGPIMRSWMCGAIIMGLTAAKTHADPSIRSTETGIDAVFTRFMSKFGKEYSSVEERSRRMSVFAANVEHVKELNQRDAHANYSALTRWADLTAAEFASIHGLEPNTMCQLVEPAPTLHPAAKPKESIDYVAMGATVEVKNQGNCGSCWAHATTAAVEGRLKIDTGRTTSLSVEFLIDCDTARVCQGCCGGLNERALQWLAGSPGIASTEDYPYTSAGGSDGKACNTSAPLTARVTGYGIVPQDAMLAGNTEYVTASRTPDLKPLRLLSPPLTASQTPDLQPPSTLLSAAAVLTLCSPRRSISACRYGVLATAMDSRPLQFYTGGVITDLIGCQSTSNHVSLRGLSNPGFCTACLLC